MPLYLGTYAQDEAANPSGQHMAARVVAGVGAPFDLTRDIRFSLCCSRSPRIAISIIERAKFSSYSDIEVINRTCVRRNEDNTTRFNIRTPSPTPTKIV